MLVIAIFRQQTNGDTNSIFLGAVGLWFSPDFSGWFMFCNVFGDIRTGLLNIFDSKMTKHLLKGDT